MVKQNNITSSRLHHTQTQTHTHWREHKHKRLVELLNLSHAEVLLSASFCVGALISMGSFVIFNMYKLRSQMVAANNSCCIILWTQFTNMHLTYHIHTNTLCFPLLSMTLTMLSQKREFSFWWKIRSLLNVLSYHSFMCALYECYTLQQPTYKNIHMNNARCFR